MDFSLNEEDIPGAKLPKPIIIDECTRGILRRWLLCRGATTSETRRITTSVSQLNDSHGLG